jgi:excisionase family DNA binding protein
MRGQTPVPQAVYSVKQAADVLQLSPRHVRRLIESGDLDAVIFGPRSKRIPQAAIEALLSQDHPA